MTRRILALLAAVALLLAGPAATPALAAFTVLSSNPAAGATVAVPPADVQITFDQPVDELVSTVTVRAPRSGDIFNNGVLRAPNGSTVSQSVRHLPSGTYEVAWTVGAAANSPTTSGKFSFTVNTPPEPQAGAGQWLVIAVLAVIIALLGSALVRRRASRREAGGVNRSAAGRRR